MASLIKDVYSREFYNSFSEVLQKTLPDFSKPTYIKRIYVTAFAQMEWKERMTHSTSVLHGFLPAKFSEASKIIIDIVKQLSAGKHNAFPYLFLADYIATYGIDDLKSSVKAIEVTTQFISCEFAVRPFLLRYNTKMLQQMIDWSGHPSYAVRRLASEGSRPRLPWAMALPAYKKDPSPLLPLLENLKNDPHEWVRLSVANHLNDISKDHPDVLLSIAGKWKGTSKETDAILKHASRTLLKKGHPEILKVFLLSDEGIEASQFKIVTPQVKMGDHLLFTFTIKNTLHKPAIVRLEYAVYYRKLRGELSKKVFKISERLFQPGETVTIQRKQSFKAITTRVFYSGAHKLSLIVNGVEKSVKSFTLVDA